MDLTVETVDAERINGQGLGDFDLLCVPGGNMYLYAGQLGDDGRSKIRSFVNSGGGYVGICGGAYYAAEEVCFGGFRIPMEPLGLFPGRACGPIRGLRFAWPRMCSVERLDGGPGDFPGSAEKHSMLYVISPGLRPASKEFQGGLLRYAKTDCLAAAALEHGRGRVFLIGTHPEIEVDGVRDGLDYLEHLDDQGSDWDYMRGAVNWCLGAER